MSKIGKLIRKDFEFTGCTDATLSVIRSSAPWENLLKRPSIVVGGGAPGVYLKDFLKAGKPREIAIQLTDQQKKLAKRVLGKTPSKLNISIIPKPKTVEIPLTRKQQKSIEADLGIEVKSFSVFRDTIEFGLW